jgi:hypothetical protein
VCFNIDYNLSLHHTGIIIIAGDTSKFDCSKLETDYSLSNTVNQASRGAALLANCFTNTKNLFLAVTVMESVIKTDHNTVILASVSADTQLSWKSQCSFSADNTKIEYM